MHNKNRFLLDSLKTEAGRHSTVVGSSAAVKQPRDNHKNLRLERSPNSSNKLTFGRANLKSPDISRATPFSNRYNKSTYNLKKITQGVGKSPIRTRDVSQSFTQHTEVPTLHTQSSEPDSEITTTRATFNPKAATDAELSELLKSYMGGFSQYESSCITTFCVKHQDAKTEFFTRFGQLMVGFCSVCAVKYASNSLVIEPYRQTAIKKSKQAQIDGFLKKIGETKRHFNQKATDLTKAQRVCDIISIDEQKTHLEEMFDSMIESLKLQKEMMLGELSNWFDGCRSAGLKSVENICSDTRFIEKIERDILDNYQSILDNVNQDDFDMILSHHQAQLAERQRLVEDIRPDFPKPITSQETSRIKDKFAASLREELLRFYPGIEAKMPHYSMPTFKNFSPQNGDKGGIVPVNRLAISSSSKSNKRSPQSTPKDQSLMDSDLKNIPSIDNFMSQEADDQVRTDSHKEDYLPQNDSDDRFWEEGRGNCFLNVDPSK